MVYKGIDLTNTDSVKVCVDMWDAVVNQHQYMSMSDVNAIASLLGLAAGSSADAIEAAVVKLQKNLQDEGITVDNLNKQIPDLEAAASKSATEAADWKSQAIDPTSNLPYKALYIQANDDLTTARQAIADNEKTYNQKLGQYANTSYLLVDGKTLLGELLKRVYNRLTGRSIIGGTS